MYLPDMAILKFFAILVKWSDEDKDKLLQALEKHGANNLEALAEELPLKSVSEIRSTISHYQQLASLAMSHSKVKLRVDDICIDKWAKIIRHITGRNCPTIEVSKALKYIALFERRKHEGTDHLR